jgi:exosortase A
MNTLLAAPQARTWRSVVPAALLCIAMLLLFRETVAAMVSIWIRSDTFNHAFLVPPIAVWLAWRRRADLAIQPRQPVPWVLLPLLLACLLWLLGYLGGVAAASQWALVTLLLLTVPALFGWSVTRVLLFPMLFLYFAVPFGEFVVPQLQEWTADVTVMALRASGIPVYREGHQFIIPSGSWSVVEACSGIHYLIACFVVGTLFAYLNYRSTRRRVAFMLVLLVFPILANWIRAYTIVTIGHLTGSPMILGVSHMTYGWVLFGALIMLLFVVAARWAEHEELPVSPLPTRPVEAASRGGVWWMFSAILVLVVGTQALAWRLDHRAPLPSPSLQLPEGSGGWRVDAGVKEAPWQPGFVNPSANVFEAYEKAGRHVGVWVGYYRSEGDDRKLVSSVNGVVAAEDTAWRQQKTGNRPATVELPALQTSTVTRGSVLGFTDTERMQVWQLYWIGGRWTHSDTETKLWQIWDRLLGRGDEGAVVLLITPLADDADAVLGEFAKGNLAEIDAALVATRDSR